MFLDFIEYSNISTKLIFLILIFFSIYHILFYKLEDNFFRIEKYFFIFQFFIPLILFIPFSFNGLNTSASSGFLSYRYLINDVVLINFFGVLSYLIGVYFFGKIPQASGKIISKISFYFWHGFNNKYLSFIYILFGLLVIFLLISSGVSLGSGREFAMLNPTIRPFILLYIILINFFFYYVIAKYFLTKKIKHLFYICILIFLSLVSGTRGALIGPIIFSLFMYNYCFNKKVRPLLIVKMFFYFILTLISLQAVLLLRGNNSGDRSFISDLIYGNTFSDIRDFAWVLSGWDGNYLIGKTQLAGFMSFIPSFLSSFRQEWNWGIYSTGLANLDPTVHPGLRPGFFGEIFINFGYIGVIFLGLFSGFLIEYYSRVIEKSKVNFDKMLRLYVLGGLFIILLFNFAITSGFFRNYIFLLLLLLFIFLNNFMSKLFQIYGKK